MKRSVFCCLPLILALGCAFADDDLGTAAEPLKSENGLSLNGMSLNGLSLNGMSLNGLSLNGLSLNGLSLIELSEVGFVNFDELNPDLQQAVTGRTAKARLARSFLRYFAKCALPEGVTVTIGAGVGVALPVSIGGDARLAEPLVLTGIFGIAQDWPNVSENDRDRVATCLAGHVNPIQGVAISLRSNWVSYTAGEVSEYDVVEGLISASWGDTIEGVTCRGVDYQSALPFRTFISQGGSGFSVLGDCPALCQTSSAQTGYANCGAPFNGTGSLTSFIALQSEVDELAVAF